MALTREQRQFIKKKVKQLGTYEDVRLFYRKDCLVARFAWETAEKMWPDQKPAPKQRARR